MKMKVAFSVRIPHGQDISKIYVGWSTPRFLFMPEKSLVVNTLLDIITPGEDDKEWVSSEKLSASFVVRLSELIQDSAVYDDDIV